MSQLSIEATSQNWSRGFEFELWEAVNDRITQYGELNFTPDVVKNLKKLSNNANGWIIMEEDSIPKLITLKEFKVLREKEISDGLNWTNEAGNSLNTSDWFGSIFWYLLSGTKTEFNSIYSKKNLKRNAITGWIIQMLLLLSFFAFIYMYF